MDKKEPITLGRLKKEKSSKPIFVIFVFALLIGCCFGLPYIKAYIGEDITIKDLLNDIKIPGKVENTTKTTTQVTTPADIVVNIECKKDNNKYIYTTTNDTLSRVHHIFEYKYNNSENDENLYNLYIARKEKLTSNKAYATLIKYEDGSGFVFENIITVEGDFTLIDDNYYLLGTISEKILTEMKNKGYDCK